MRLDPIATAPLKRDLYTARELGRMLAPRSIAVLGASDTLGNFGRRRVDLQCCCIALREQQLAHPLLVKTFQPGHGRRSADC